MVTQRRRLTYVRVSAKFNLLISNSITNNYINFLIKPFIEKILNDAEQENLFVFDIEWYHTIIEQQPAKAYSYDKAKISMALERLENDKNFF